jgi:predicted TIM-barrel fold metal-dependent hydrolase
MRNWLPRPRYPNPFGERLDDDAATSLETLRAVRLDPQRIARGLLVFDRAMFVPVNPNPYLAAALVRAINDWNLDRWLHRDERLYGLALVPTQTPDVAAAEIARVGSDPKIAGVLLAAPALGKSLGHPVYDPIYRAAAELELPIVLHRGGDGLLDIPAGPAGGAPLTFAEYNAVAPLAVVTQLVSLIANGVLDKYPSLRMYLIGAGLAWIPSFLLRFEMMIRALRREVPWARRAGADYLEQQVRTSTYGIELDGGADDDGGGGAILTRILERHPEFCEWTIYGSGFPSWDTVEAGDVGLAFPASARAAIFADTARAWLRWPAT